MRLFYYVHTGHRIGLDRFRRAATIIRELGDVDITLLTSDFRIASVARDYGVNRAVGVDVVRNIPQIAHHGDQIIFDSAEANPALLADMQRFFSTFIRVSDDPEDEKGAGEFLLSPYLEGEDIYRGFAIDPACFEAKEKRIKRAFFFGDDDYEEDLLKHLDMFRGHGMELLLGFYWFFGYEEKVGDAFGKQHESEEYDEVVRGSEVLVTASPQAALENLASGGRPVFLQRPDYPRDYISCFESLNIPVVDGYDEVRLSQVLDSVESHAYRVLENNTHKLGEFIKGRLNL
jgi:hypothetical protein